MRGSTRTKALLASRSIARWKSQLPSWRKKSPRQPVRLLRRQRKQRPPERRPAPAAPQGAAVSSPPSCKSPRRLRQQLNNHRRHLLLPHQPLRHELDASTFQRFVQV